MLVVDAEDDVAVHVDQPAVGVVGKPLVVRSLPPAPATDSSLSPRLRIVFIMPGIEMAAPTAHREQQRDLACRRTSCRSPSRARRSAS